LAFISPHDFVDAFLGEHLIVFNEEGANSLTDAIGGKAVLKVSHEIWILHLTHGASINSVYSLKHTLSSASLVLISKTKMLEIRNGFALRALEADVRSLVFSVWEVARYTGQVEIVANVTNKGTCDPLLKRVVIIGLILVTIRVGGDLRA